MTDDARSVLAPYFAHAQRIPGWTRGEEAEALAEICLAAPEDAVIVEIGSFFGCATVLMAGARVVRGTGKVFAIDPFDASGDAVSTPHYRALMLAFAGRSQRDHFEDNLAVAGVADAVTVYQGTALEAADGWSLPIDVLFLDGDQSPEGARTAYDAWAPFLKAGGTIALHNSADRDYEPGHEGHWRLVHEELLTPRYADVRVVGSTTFAVRTPIGAG